MNKKMKIVWVVDAWFVDCDFREQFIKELAEKYDIVWIVLLRNINRYKKEDFDVLKPYIDIEFVTFDCKGYSFRNFIKYNSISKIIKRVNPELIYMNVSWSVFMLPLFMKIRNRPLLLAAHQGEVHPGMSHKTITKVIRNVVYKSAAYVQLFSEEQARLFRNHYTKPHVFVNYLGLKDFGAASILRPKKNGKTIFLAFGIINYAKHIDLLIDAACCLVEDGYKDFGVVIKGGCSNWDDYKKKIRYPDVFETDIRLIDNAEIPDLFTSAHYFVQPYRILSQSGPTKIAFRYNTPIIASDLPAFKEEIVEDVNGYLFKTNDVVDLKEKMKNAILQTDEDYEKLLGKMSVHTNELYSDFALAKKYEQMFNEIIINKQL